MIIDTNKKREGSPIVNLMVCRWASEYRSRHTIQHHIQEKLCNIACNVLGMLDCLRQPHLIHVYELTYFNYPWGKKVVHCELCKNICIFSGQIFCDKLGTLTLHFLASSSWTFSEWKCDPGPDGQHKSRSQGRPSLQPEDVPHTQLPGSGYVSTPGFQCLLWLPRQSPEKIPVCQQQALREVPNLFK